MPLVESKGIIADAMNNGYAIGAFNVNCLEQISPLVKAAEDENSPLIIQIGQKFIKYIDLPATTAYVRKLAHDANVPIAIHLDHSHDVYQCIKCIDMGFTSIMYDGSQKTIEENIEDTKAVVKAAHSRNVTVEGEVGVVGIYINQSRNEKIQLSDPNEVKYFVDVTGIDLVAVAVGNIHQMIVKNANLDIERIKEIRKQVHIPIVLHGSTGVSDKQLLDAIKAGISKVNISTEFNYVFSKGIRGFLNKSDEIYPMEIFKDAIENVYKLAREKIELLGSRGRAALI